MEIYYKSDFSLVEIFLNAEGVVVDPRTLEFVLIYKTSTQETFTASHLNDVYTNCSYNEEENGINVYFGNHNLKAGILTRELTIYQTDTEFPDDIKKLISLLDCDVTLVCSGGDGINYTEEQILLAIGQTGNGIESVTKTGTLGLTDTYTILYTDETSTTFNILNGKGIVSILKTGTLGLVDTYTITYNDETTTTFPVTNGAQGIQGDKGVQGDTGNGISSVSLLSEIGLIKTYRITFTNATTYDYAVANGNGIASVVKTSTVGLIDTYTITFTDGTTTTFPITNGADGIDSDEIKYNSVILSTVTIALQNTIEVYHHSPYEIPTYIFDTSALTNATDVIRFQLVINMPPTAVTPVFPPSVTWYVTPSFATGNRKYVIWFTSYDGGITWVGNLLGSFIHTSFTTTWNVSAGETIYFPFVNTAPSDSETVIAWGDGSTTTLTAGQALGTTGIAHTYTNADTYTITVYNKAGKMPSFYFFTVQTSKNNIISVVTPMLTMYNGSTVITVVSALFRNCINLTDVCYNFFQNNSQLTQIWSSFFFTSSLLSIPNDLMSYFSPSFFVIKDSLFAYSGITTIPDFLFQNVIIDASSNTLFTYCYSLKFKANLFCEETEENMSTRFASLSPSFNSLIYRETYTSSAVGGTAPQLWNYQYNEVVTLSSTTGIVAGNIIKDSVTGAYFTVVTVLTSTTLKIRYLRWNNLTGTYSNFVAGHTILINDTASAITFTSISGSPIKTGCYGGNGNNSATLLNKDLIPWEWCN